MNTRLCVKLSSFPLIAVLTSSIAQSALVSYDSFSGYTAGELPDNAAPAVAGYTGNWVGTDFGAQQPSITVGSLVYADALYAGSAGDRVTVPNNTAGGEITATNSGRAYHSLDSTLAVTSTTQGSLYLSFLFQSGQQTGATTYQTLHLNQGTNGDTNRSFDIGITNNGGSTGLQYNFGVNGTYTSTGVATNTTVRLFVVKFNLSSVAGGDSVTVWTNPTLGGVGDPAGGVTVSNTNFVWNNLMLSDYDGNSAAWDEIRWGTDFNSVTVPEPSAALLGSLGVLALFRRKRA